MTTEDKYPDFLPLWTHALEEIHGRDDDPIPILVARNEYDLDWFSGTCCFTGEAFFNKQAPFRECHVCDSLTHASSEMVDDLGRFYIYKEKLAKHLIKVHPEIWDMWKEKMS